MLIITFLALFINKDHAFHIDSLILVNLPDPGEWEQIGGVSRFPLVFSKIRSPGNRNSVMGNLNVKYNNSEKTGVDHKDPWNHK